MHSNTLLYIHTSMVFLFSSLITYYIFFLFLSSNWNILALVYSR